MYGEQAEAEAPAQPPHARVGRREWRFAAGEGPLAPCRHCQVDEVGDREPVDGLQHEAKGERQLQLDHDRRVCRSAAAMARPDSDHVAAANLALRLVAETLEEALYRLVQVDLALKNRRGTTGRWDEGVGEELAGIERVQRLASPR